MPDSSSQTFLRQLDKKLWTAADKLRPKGAQASRLFVQREESTARMAVLPSRITSTGKLIDLIATIPFQHADLHAKAIPGHVYDTSGGTKSLPNESPKGERRGAHQYFLGQFALAEGKKGGQYFTPKSIVSLIVEMLEPYQARVYYPAMGSGGFFACGYWPRSLRCARRTRPWASGVAKKLIKEPCKEPADGITRYRVSTCSVELEIWSQLFCHSSQSSIERKTDENDIVRIP